MVGLCTDLAREQAERRAEGESMHYLEHICSGLEVNGMHVVSAHEVASHQHSVFSALKSIQDKTFKINLSGPCHLACRGVDSQQGVGISFWQIMNS